MKKKSGFTLAEALITLTILGIVAVMAIPSVVTNHRQTRFKTGLKKAIKSLNETISMNVAKGEKSAFYTNDLFEYLQKNMSVISSTNISRRDSNNKEFFTSDGMRFEIPKSSTEKSSEFSDLIISDNNGNSDELNVKISNCGTQGMGIGGNANVQSAPPCIILADVNGDKSPNKLSDNEELHDMALIIITDKGAFPYGEAAQKAFYDEN